MLFGRTSPRPIVETLKASRKLFRYFIQPYKTEIEGISEVNSCAHIVPLVKNTYDSGTKKHIENDDGDG